MARPKDPVGHWKDLEAWLSVATDSPLPKAAETLQHLTQDQLDENLNSLMKQDPSKSYNHKDLAKITGTLSHVLITTLKLSDRHSAQLQHKLTHVQSRINQLELEAQERPEQPDETDQAAEEEIDKLHETLAATTQEMEQAKAEHADVANKLEYVEQLLEEVNADSKDKDSRIKALETHLSEARHEVRRLTQQLDYIKEESNSTKDELKHAYELTHNEKAEGSLPKPSPSPSVPDNHVSPCGLDLRDLDKLVKNLGKFTPNLPGSQDVHAYLQDIDFHLEMRPNVTDKDRLYLLRATSSPEVRSFLDRQPAHTKTDYLLLREALIREFDDIESEQGLVAALETKQGRHESSQAYYSRLRRAYFGTRNEPEMEEDLNFKILFLRNLHPGVSHHLGVLACPHTMNTQQLRDLAHKAYVKQKTASEKSAKIPAVYDFNTQSQDVALEGARGPDNARLPPSEWNVSSYNRQRDCHADTRPKQRNRRWKGLSGRQHSPERHRERPWNRSTSFVNQRGTSSWESSGTSKVKQHHLDTTSPRGQRKNSQRFHADRTPTESPQGTTSPCFDPQELMKMILKEFFQRREADRKWERKGKPDSA
ncbi:uncharacterized protein [Danio rerio]|uniref:Uncharacterized protein n=1 Tax=Danio rerio TaxID=7955 RepID=A0AC58JAX2_DANRE